MNCKPGDLAVVIKGQRSRGLIVRVLHAAKDGDDTVSKCGKVLKAICRDTPVWHLEGFVWRLATDGSTLLVPLVNDGDIRPIRDTPGDESWFKAAPLTEKPALTFEQVRRALGRREPA